MLRTEGKYPTFDRAAPATPAHPAATSQSRRRTSAPRGNQDLAQRRHPVLHAACDHDRDRRDARRGAGLHRQAVRPNPKVRRLVEDLARRSRAARISAGAVAPSAELSAAVHRADPAPARRAACSRKLLARATGIPARRAGNSPPRSRGADLPGDHARVCGHDDDLPAGVRPAAVHRHLRQQGRGAAGADQDAHGHEQFPRRALASHCSSASSPARRRSRCSTSHGRRRRARHYLQLQHATARRDVSQAASRPRPAHDRHDGRRGHQPDRLRLHRATTLCATAISATCGTNVSEQDSDRQADGRAAEPAVRWYRDRSRR